MSMRDMDDLFVSLAKSPFRRKFKLQDKDLAYLQDKGLSLVLTHAAEFIKTRLAPTQIPNDGKQTPMRGHPVFVAQHATATCCRGCLQKWHAIPKGHQLSESEQAYIVKVIARWLQQVPAGAQLDNIGYASASPKQFDIFQ